MTTAKINFEMDRDVLATAQAFAAKHRVSLNKLVSTYFASLGQEDKAAMPVDGRLSVLLEVSQGKVSITDAARELGLGDAGHVLALMRQAKIPITLKPLPANFVKNQADSALEAMRSCMLPVVPKEPARRTKSARAVV